MELIVMVGLSGSGKSTKAKEIQKYKNNCIILSSDQLRKELLGDENDQEHNDKVFKTLHRLIKENINDKNIIVDATNINYKSRKPILNCVKGIKNCKKIAYVMTESVENCVLRQAGRERRVPTTAIEKQMNRFQIPFYEEGFDEIILDQWEDKYSSFVEGFDLEKNYIFDLMKGFNQNNHHHKYTLDIHCKKVSELLEKEFPNDNVIKIAGLIHDIGKIYTGKLKEDNSGEYSYHSHHNVGTYFLLQNLNCIGLNNKNDILKCLFIINYHMEPFFWHSEKAEYKWKNIFGENNFNLLKIFNKCDIIGSGR